MGLPPGIVIAVSRRTVRPPERARGADELRRLGRDAGVRRLDAHRFRHTFATWAIAHDARQLDSQHLLGHGSPEMVRRYSATYGSAQAAERHAAFSPGDGMLVGTS